MPNTMPTLRAELATAAATPAWSRGMLDDGDRADRGVQHRVPGADHEVGREQPAERGALAGSAISAPAPAASISIPPISTPRGPRVPTR